MSSTVDKDGTVQSGRQICTTCASQVTDRSNELSFATLFYNRHRTSTHFARRCWSYFSKEGNPGLCAPRTWAPSQSSCLVLSMLYSFCPVLPASVGTWCFSSLFSYSWSLFLLLQPPIWEPILSVSCWTPPCSLFPSLFQQLLSLCVVLFWFFIKSEYLPCTCLPFSSKLSLVCFHFSDPRPTVKVYSQYSCFTGYLIIFVDLGPKLPAHQVQALLL